jgi:O-antigen/teichoic acid export membrane protein
MKLISHYWNKTIAHPVFRQLQWYMIGQIAVQVFSFLGVIVTSRYLGPTNVGLYSFVQNYLLAFMTLTIGMDFYFTWKVAKSEEQVQEVKEYFGHKVNVTLFLSIVGIAAAWSILPRDVAIMATVMFVPLVLTSCMAFYQYAVATRNARIIAIFQFGAALLLFITKMVLVHIHAPLIGFIVVNTIDTVVVGTVLAAFFLSHRNIRSVFLRSKYPSLFETVQFMYSIRMSLIAIALWQLILRVDQLVLATFSNAYTLGIYAAAVKIAEVPNFLAGVLYTALVTHVALFADKDDTHSKRRTRQVLLLYAGIGVAIAVLILIFAPLAIRILYGSKFLEAIPVLRAYAFSIPGMFVTLHYFGIYGTREQHGFQSAVFLIGLLLNIALIYFLTPLLGLQGAALATAIAYDTIAFIFYLHVR